MAYRRNYGYFYAPYVSVAERRRDAEKLVEKLKKQGRNPKPILAFKGAIARSFWGKSWCSCMESYADYENRLDRGKSYLRSGCVCHLDIRRGDIDAIVNGSDPYDVSIRIDELDKKRVDELEKLAKGKISSQLDLLQGKIPEDIKEVVGSPYKGIIPFPKEIHFECSCPDSARMCKHVAAVLYAVGRRLDDEPTLLFSLRGLDPDILVTMAGDMDLKPDAGEEVVGEDVALGDLFGIDLGDMGQSASFLDMALGGDGAGSAGDAGNVDAAGNKTEDARDDAAASAESGDKAGKAKSTSKAVSKTASKVASKTAPKSTKAKDADRAGNMKTSKTSKPKTKAVTPKNGQDAPDFFELLDDLSAVMTGTSLLAALEHLHQDLSLPKGIGPSSRLLLLSDEELEILGGQKVLDEFRERMAKDLKRLRIKRSPAEVPHDVWTVMVRLYMLERWEKEHHPEDPDLDRSFADTVLQNWASGLVSPVLESQMKVMTAILFDTYVENEENFPYRRRLLERLPDFPAMPPGLGPMESGKILTATPKTSSGKASGKAPGKSTLPPTGGKKLIPGLAAPKAASKPAGAAGTRAAALAAGKTSGEAGAAAGTKKAVKAKTPKQAPKPAVKPAPKPAPKPKTPFVPTITPPFDPEHPTAEGIQELFRLSSCAEDEFAYKVGVGKLTAKRWLEARGSIYLTKDSLKKVSRYQLKLLKKIAGVK